MLKCHIVLIIGSATFDFWTENGSGRMYWAVLSHIFSASMTGITRPVPYHDCSSLQPTADRVLIDHIRQLQWLKSCPTIIIDTPTLAYGAKTLIIIFTIYHQLKWHMFVYWSSFCKSS